MRSERRSRSEGTAADDDDTATQEQQLHAGWRNTYSEHVAHVRHRAHVPVTDVLIEGRSFLQRSEGRAAVWSERRSRSEGMDDEDDTATQEQQHARWRNTYIEHASHVRHRAHVPVTDVLIEDSGILHRSEGQTAVRSEERSRGEGMGDDNDTATQEQQLHAGWRITYIEHARHARHRAHVPSTDGLIEALGTL